MSDPIRFDDATLDEHVETLFLVDGPHTPDKTAAAGRAMAGLARYLAYAAERESGTPYPATVYQVIGSLSDTTARLGEVLERTNRRFRVLAAQPGAYSTGGDVPPDGMTLAQLEASRVDDHLSVAHDLFGSALAHIARAHSYAGRVGQREPGADR
jgi:hypothetical protein